MTQAGIRAIFCAFAATAALSGCVAPGGGASGDGAAAPVARAATSTRLVDRDVEAPEVFQATDQALWDGRPSLGGVWVASPDAVDPERVILRNPGNGKFVIGALFRRERLNPGPPLQISSDAAAALGLLAGQPATLNVTALRKEEVADRPVAEAPVAAIPDETPVAAAADEAAAVETTALASAAIDRAEGKLPAPEPAPEAAALPEAETAVLTPEAPKKRLPFWKRRAAKAEAPAEAVAAAPAEAGIATEALEATVIPAAAPATPAPRAAGVIQIGIFAVEANARRAADALTAGGVQARILTEASQGKTFWRVVADPAADRAATLAKVKAAGFADAYFLRG